MYHALREITAHARVNIAALVHDEEEASHAGDLAGLAESVLTARVPHLRNVVRAMASVFGATPDPRLARFARSVPAINELVRKNRPDVILAYCSSMARFALAPPLADIPCVIDMIDADSAKWATLARGRGMPLRWIYAREARLLGKFEVVAMQRAFTTLVVNEKERAALDALAPGSRVEVIENGVDLAAFKPPSEPEDSASVVFCGVMNYGPNEQGAVWLVREVWPLVRAVQPRARLLLVGSSPSSKVRALASDTSGVIVTGRVADVRRYLWEAAVAAAPLHVARGVQNKVLEAIAAGLPCVVTPEVAEGLPLEVVPACCIGEDHQQFASAVCDLLARTPGERRARALRADLTSLHWAERLRPLMPLLKAASRSTRRPTYSAP